MLRSYQGQRSNTNTFAQHFDEWGEEVHERRFVRLHRDGYLDLVKQMKPHLLQTLVVLASHMGEDRVGHISSKVAATELNLERDVARNRLNELAEVTIEGRRLIEVRLTQDRPHFPAVWHIQFSNLVPLSFGGDWVTEERWIKLFDSARDLPSKLSSQSHVTLLALATGMTKTRTSRGSFRSLAEVLGVRPLTVQKRIDELVSSGVVAKVSSKSGNFYRIAESVGVSFGSSCVTSEVEGVSLWTPPRGVSLWTPPIKRVKERFKETNKETASPVVVFFQSKKDEDEERRTRGKDPTESIPHAPQGPTEQVSKFCSGQVREKLWLDWIKAYGESRVLEIESAAKLQKRPGGWMRRALEEGWVLASPSDKSENRVGDQGWRLDHRVSQKRASELAGETFGSEGDGIERSQSAQIARRLRESMRSDKSPGDGQKTRPMSGRTHYHQPKRPKASVLTDKRAVFTAKRVVSPAIWAELADKRSVTAGQRLSDVSSA